MANSDYEQTGAGTFASVIELDAAMDYATTAITFTIYNFHRPSPIEVGMALLVDDEIMRIETVGILDITVKRGCADTTPRPHAAGAPGWIFQRNVGTDKKEWSAGEEIGVKVQPYTTGGGVLPRASIAPDAVEFNWRFFRPYPPAQLRVNGAPWYTPSRVDDDTPDLHLTWVDRDRVLQADQLVGHLDAGIGPEPGATNTFRVFDAMTEDVVRVETGIRGNTFIYQRAQALHDQGNPTADVATRFTFTGTRDGFDSWQGYAASFTVAPGVVDAPNFLAFDQRVIESPYLLNLVSPASAEGNHAIGVAARPSDRQADDYALMADGAEVVTTAFTPWVTLDFRLPELETIVNVRSSSLYDGVALTGLADGTLALIDDEIVMVETPGVNQIVVRRGCLDTVPAVHLAGARMWLLGLTRALDAADRATDTTVAYKARPGLYGAPVDLADLPTESVTFAGRALRPYPPGQVVVAGRPWFEEAQVISGTSLSISWARRNRITQGAEVTWHALSDVAPESGQVTRLTFYYETPSSTPGAPADRHVLREVDTPLAAHAYSYSQAQADGGIAGAALGVCGTVVIQCQLYAVRAGLASTQRYVIPIRVPSFPCPV